MFEVFIWCEKKSQARKFSTGPVNNSLQNLHNRLNCRRFTGSLRILALAATAQICEVFELYGS
jgi:hypothetical protein